MSKTPEYDLDRLAALFDRYRIASGHGFDLESRASDDLPSDAPDKHGAESLLAAATARMALLQERLYASGTWSLLVVLQGMDAAGKDSTIKHVMSGINPQGVAVTSFKAPGSVALAHDFLWRIHQAVPDRGMIGIFNRSHYEDVLVTRVHEDRLRAANLPGELLERETFWSDRIADIAAFEAYLGRQGVRLIKIFLNVGRDEQKERLLKRLDDPDKGWKFDPADLRERALWPKYRAAYQAAIAGTATQAAPWFVVPADRKWFTRLVVGEIIVEALERLDLKTPALTDADRAAIEEARQALASA